MRQFIHIWLCALQQLTLRQIYGSMQIALLGYAQSSAFSELANRHCCYHVTVTMSRLANGHTRHMCRPRLFLSFCQFSQIEIHNTRAVYLIRWFVSLCHVSAAAVTLLFNFNAIQTLFVFFFVRFAKNPLAYQSPFQCDLTRRQDCWTDVLPRALDTFA